MDTISEAFAESKDLFTGLYLAENWDWIITYPVVKIDFAQGIYRTKLHELLKINLRTVKAYLFKEDFDHLWTYNHPNWAGGFIDQWTEM